MQFTIFSTKQNKNTIKAMFALADSGLKNGLIAIETRVRPDSIVFGLKSGLKDNISGVFKLEGASDVEDTAFFQTALNALPQLISDSKSDVTVAVDGEQAVTTSGSIERQFTLKRIDAQESCMDNYIGTAESNAASISAEQFNSIAVRTIWSTDSKLKTRDFADFVMFEFGADKNLAVSTTGYTLAISEFDAEQQPGKELAIAVKAGAIKVIAKNNMSNNVTVIKQEPGWILSNEAITLAGKTCDFPNWKRAAGTIDKREFFLVEAKTDFKPLVSACKSIKNHCTYISFKDGFMHCFQKEGSSETRLKYPVETSGVEDNGFAVNANYLAGAVNACDTREARVKFASDNSMRIEVVGDSYRAIIMQVRA